MQNTPELTHIKERTRDDLWGFCKTCYYADICKAGCTWTSHCLTGRPGNNPYCIHRATTLEKEGLRERIVKRGPAPGLPFDHGLFDIITEPMPVTEEGAPLSVAGKPLSEVIALGTSASSAWDKSTITGRLKRR